MQFDRAKQIGAIGINILVDHKGGVKMRGTGDALSWFLKEKGSHIEDFRRHFLQNGEHNCISKGVNCFTCQIR